MANDPSFSHFLSIMGNIFAEKCHKFHPSHQLYFTNKSLQDIDIISTRKLLINRAIDSVMDSPEAKDTLFYKFLPNNSVDDEDDSDPYSNDNFRMYEFKVRRCTRSRNHDWTDCPFAHPGEKARRRDPRKYCYSSTVCPDFRKGNCSRGDNCEFAHGVFECWLHPGRYRTEACKDGKNCKRRVCFFAHTPRQLRLLPADNHLDKASSSPRNSKTRRDLKNCCFCCNSVSASPTSTLIGMSHLSPPMSPSLSPPVSPAKTHLGFSPISRFGSANYKDRLNELLCCFEAMNVNNIEANSSGSGAKFDGNVPWMDVNFDCNYDDQQQFILSPSTPAQVSSNKFYAGDFDFPASSSRSSLEETSSIKYYNENVSGGPDLGWVNDLLT